MSLYRNGRLIGRGRTLRDTLRHAQDGDEIVFVVRPSKARRVLTVSQELRALWRIK